MARQRRRDPPDRARRAALQRSASLTLGEPIADDEVEFCVEELALDPWARELKWQRPPARNRLEQFHVTVIGAGLGGLAAAPMLKRAGIAHTVIEKNAGVGGTWNETRYPGGRLDTPSRAYTHLFGAHFPYVGPSPTGPRTSATSTGSPTRSGCARRSSSTRRCAR